MLSVSGGSERLQLTSALSTLFRNVICLEGTRSLEERDGCSDGHHPPQMSFAKKGSHSSDTYQQILAPFPREICAGIQRTPLKKRGKKPQNKTKVKKEKEKGHSCLP